VQAKIVGVEEGECSRVGGGRENVGDRAVGVEERVAAARVWKVRGGVRVVGGRRQG
jgi:hypothetical protein